MKLSNARVVLAFLTFRHFKSTLRTKSRHWKVAERFIFRILSFLVNRVGQSGAAPTTSKDSISLDKEKLTVSCWKNNISLKKTLRSMDFELPSRFRRAIVTFPAVSTELSETLLTINHLVDGSTAQRPFSVLQHQVQEIYLRNVNFFRFKYLYNDSEVFIYDQFVDEFSPEYYGRNSDVFFLKEKLCAYGYFPNPRSSENIGHYYSVFGHYYNNYWHFMIEYLPKLFLIPRGMTVLVPNDLFFTLILKLITERLGLKVKSIDPNRAYKFSGLSIFTTPVKYCDSNVTSVDSTQLLSLKDLLTMSPSMDNSNKNAKIFLERRSIRRMNADSLLQSELKSIGFALIDPSDKSLNYQRELFAQSRLICAYPGANWANLIFAKSSCLYLNLTSPKNLDQCLHHAIASVFGVQLQNFTLCNAKVFKSVVSNSYSESEKATLKFDKQSVESFLKLAEVLSKESDI